MTLCQERGSFPRWLLGSSKPAWAIGEAFPDQLFSIVERTSFAVTCRGVRRNAVLTLRDGSLAHDWVSDRLGRRAPDASRRELHRQRCDAGEEFRARVGRHRASPRRRRPFVRERWTTAARTSTGLHRHRPDTSAVPKSPFARLTTAAVGGHDFDPNDFACYRRCVEGARSRRVAGIKQRDRHETSP